MAPVASPATASLPSAASPVVPPGIGPAAGASAAPVAPSAPVVPVVPAVADDTERRVELEARGLSLAFTNKGARLLSWQLLEFRDRRGRPEEMVRMVPGGPRPLDIETGDPTLDNRLREALFRPSAVRVAPPEGDAVLRFEFAEGDIEASKTLTVRGDDGLLAVRASVRRAGTDLPVKLLWGPGLGTPTPEERGVQGYHPPQAVYDGRDGVERIPADEIGEGRGDTARWAGVESTHFTALLVPPASPARVEFRTAKVPGEEDDGLAPVASVTLAR
jgi:YidC/Oxa1 family membrane protein insertase